MADKTNDQFDDLDSFDDFDEPADDLDSDLGDDSAGGEGWDQSEDDGDGEESSAPAVDRQGGKKKSGSFSLLLIAGVVVIGGGVAYMQFFSGAPAPLPDPQYTETVAAADAAPAPMAEVQNPPVVPPMPAPMAVPAPVAPGMLTAPGDTTAIPPPPLAAGIPQPVVVPDALPSSPPSATAPVTEAPAPEQAVAGDPALRMPKVEDIMLKKSMETESVPAEPPVEPVVQDNVADLVPAVPPAPVVAETAQDELMGKIDTLGSRLTKIESDFDTYRDQAVMPAPSGENPRMAEQLSDIQDFLKVLEARLDKLAASSRSTKKVAVAPDAPDEVAPIMPKPQILGGDDGSVQPKADRRATEPVPKVAPRSGVRWVLKGAQPGRATVARAGENDVQHVEAGDSLPGIGRIKAISYQNGKWIVEGTEGEISQ